MCHTCLSLLYRCSSILDLLFFFFNDTATTEIYTLSLHDALPILRIPIARGRDFTVGDIAGGPGVVMVNETFARSEEHTSELQSRLHLVCRLLLEKKKKTQKNTACCNHYQAQILHF